jgi:hypothetical protein
MGGPLARVKAALPPPRADDLIHGNFGRRRFDFRRTVAYYTRVRR